MTRGLRGGVQNIRSKYRKSLEITWLPGGTLKFCHVTLPARIVCGVRDLQEVGGDCGDWMEWAQDRDRWRTLVNTVMNFRVP
jgi:hypothetical protein